MLKWLFRTIVMLAITFALGWGSYLMITGLPQASAAGGFQGERPSFGDDQFRRPPEGFEGEEREFGERGGFAAGFGLVSVLGHVILFAAVTFVVAVIGYLIPKKRKPAKAP